MLHRGIEAQRFGDEPLPERVVGQRHERRFPVPEGSRRPSGPAGDRVLGQSRHLRGTRGQVRDQLVRRPAAHAVGAVAGVAMSVVTSSVASSMRSTMTGSRGGVGGNSP